MNDQSTPANTATVRRIVHTVRPSSRSTSRADRSSNFDPSLQRRLTEATNKMASDGQSAQLVLDVLRDSLPSVAIEHICRDQKGVLQLPAAGALTEGLTSANDVRLQQWIQEACVSGTTKTHPLDGVNAGLAIVCPIVFRHRLPEVLVGSFTPAQRDEASIASAMQLAATHLTLADVAHRETVANSHSRTHAALLELLSKLDDCDQASTVYQTLVDDLRKFLECRRIALGLNRSEQSDCRLVAVSGVVDFDKRSAFASDMESALNEIVVRNELLVASKTDDHHHTLCNAPPMTALLDGGDAVYVVGTPLRKNDGTVIGAWLFVQESIDDKPQAIIDFARSSQNIVGSRLSFIRRSQRHPVLRSFHWLLDAIRTRTFVAAALALACLIAGLAIPTSYRIACQCQVEPVVRRFVAAPYDGTLQESFVKAGQAVATGTLLARMDPRELRWELSGLTADHASEKKKRDAADAREEFALAQQSNLEMERLALKMQLIEHRLDNLEIKSPIDGVVIAGDLEKSEGAPLSIGQAMFEIGPLDQMVIEVAIPEREVLYVQTGMSVEVRLHAAGREAVMGTINRVSPRSETRDSESVYIAEVSLDNRGGTWRPGMKGNARIVSDPHPLGWNLMHRAWESAAMWLGI